MGTAKKSRGNNVRALREELLISRAELARRAGVSALTVDRIEGGANCRVDTKRKIILALGKQIHQKHEVFPELRGASQDARSPAEKRGKAEDGEG